MQIKGPYINLGIFHTCETQRAHSKFKEKRNTSDNLGLPTLLIIKYWG